jgi:hypothetical protein
MRGKMKRLAYLSYPPLSIGQNSKVGERGM